MIIKVNRPGFDKPVRLIISNMVKYYENGTTTYIDFVGGDCIAVTDKVEDIDMKIVKALMTVELSIT